MKIRLFDRETPSRSTPTQRPPSLPEGFYRFEIMDAAINQREYEPNRPYILLTLAVRDAETRHNHLVDTRNSDILNLPIDSDESSSPIRRFWRDVVEAWPDIYDEQHEMLDEQTLVHRGFIAEARAIVYWSRTGPYTTNATDLRDHLFLRPGDPFRFPPPSK